MQPQLEQMIEKLEHLSPDRLAEVEDFIDFIQQRDRDKILRQGGKRGQTTIYSPE